MWKLYRCVCAVLFSLALCHQLDAQEYPARPVTIVVPFAAGGGTDILARFAAKYLEERLGSPFRIENKPGAGGIIATVATKASEPDGYTLLMAPSGILSVNPVMQRTPSYDPAADFAPVALVAGNPFVLLVTPSLPIRTLREFVAHAKSLGKPLALATAGPGTPHHLFPEMLKGVLGIDVTYVPYRGSAPALADLVAGHVSAMFSDLGPSHQLIANGKVRAIGVSTKERLTMLPDVPSLHETGARGFDAASWQMLVAPAKTPASVIDKLHGALAPSLASPEAKKALAGLGFAPMPPLSPGEVREFLSLEIARWGAIVRKAGIAGTL